ncbi:hypothetical protein BH10BAC3_BH10BAC3_12270 [soil metagenome]
MQSTQSGAQEIAEKIDGLQSLKYEDWKNTFQDYFREKRALGFTQTKGTGFNQVSRLLWFYKNRLDTEGNIVNSDLYNWNAYKKFVKDNEVQPFASISPQTAEWNYASPGNARSIDGKATGIGRVTFVKLDPNDAGNASSAIMYVGSPRGGLWKTTFNKSTGLVGTWTCLTDGLPNIGAVDLCIHPTNRNILYLVSGDKNAGVGNTPNGIGIMKSTDGGNSWLPTKFYDDVPPNFSYGTIRKMIMDNSNPNRMWAATTSGIIKTEDGWQTFTTEQSGSFWDIEKGRNSSNQNLIACTSSKVYTSADYGASWTTVKNDAGTGDYAFSSLRAEICVSADFANNRSFYLWYVTGTFNTTTSNIKLYSGSSSTWADKYSGTDLVHVYKDYCMAFEVSQSDFNFLYAGGVTLKQSGDAGATWIDINAGVPDGNTFSGNIHADQHYMAWDQGHLFIGNDGGVYNYNYGLGGWRFLSDGMHITQYYRISYNNNANGFRALGGAQDNGTHSSSTHIGCCDGMESLINYNDIKTMYISWQGGNVAKSIDGGTSFADFRPSSLPNDDVWITPMAIHKTNPDIIALAEYDAAGSRIQVYNGSWNDQALVSGEYVWLAFAKSAANVLYGITSSQIVKISDVTAASPTITTYNLPTSGATCVAVDPNNSAHVFYTVGGYGANKVYESTNSGQNWTPLTLNLPHVPINCILMSETANDDVYIGTDLGVFVKLGSWSYWAPYMNGLPNTRVTDLEIGGGLLTCATYGRGRWFTNLYASCVSALDLTVANDPASGPVTGYQYYTAGSTITSNRQVQGGTGTDVTYRSGNSITLTEGFNAKINNDFKAIIGPCFPGGPAPMSVATDPAIVPFTGVEPQTADNEKLKYDYMKPPIVW